MSDTPKVTEKDFCMLHRCRKSVLQPNPYDPTLCVMGAKEVGELGREPVCEPRDVMLVPVGYSLADNPAAVERGQAYLNENWEGIEGYDTYGMARGVLRAAETGDTDG